MLVRVLRLIHRYHNLILLVSSGVRYLSAWGALYAPSSWLLLAEREFIRLCVWSGCSHPAFGWSGTELTGSAVLSSPIYRGYTPLGFSLPNQRAESTVLPNQIFCRTKFLPNQVRTLLPNASYYRMAQNAEYTRWFSNAEWTWDIGAEWAFVIRAEWIYLHCTTERIRIPDELLMPNGISEWGIYRMRLEIWILNEILGFYMLALDTCLFIFLYFLF